MWLAPAFFLFLHRKLFIDWFFRNLLCATQCSVFMLPQRGRGESTLHLPEGRDAARCGMAELHRTNPFSSQVQQVACAREYKNFWNLPKNVLASIAEPVPWMIQLKDTDAEGCIHLNGKPYDLTIFIYCYLPNSVFSRTCQKLFVEVTATSAWWLWLYFYFCFYS